MKLQMKPLVWQAANLSASILSFILAQLHTLPLSLSSIREDISQTLLQLDVAMRLSSQQRNVSKHDVYILYVTSVSLPSTILELEHRCAGFNHWERITLKGRTAQSPRTNATCALLCERKNCYYVWVALFWNSLLQQHSLYLD